MYAGLGDARTEINTYLNSTPHVYDADFYASTYAALGTLQSQARSTPLNDSSTILSIQVVIDDIQRMEVLDKAGNGSPGFWHVMELEIDQPIDTEILDQKAKKELPQ
jgi:hypothetical protein